MIIEDAIYIEAHPDLVWAVTKDIEKWPKWTPTVTSAQRTDKGQFGLGSSARLKQPGQAEAVWTVTEFISGKYFKWENHRSGLRMSASHRMHSEDSGTKNVLRVEVKGIFGLLLWPVLFWALRKALAQENSGLKSRCEELSTQKPISNDLEYLENDSKKIVNK